MATLPAKYIAAQRALALAVRVDEIKHVRDLAKALETYAQQARDVELIGPAVTLRVEAETKAGHKLIAMKELGERHTGRNKQNLRGSKAGSPVNPTLKTLKLTYNQSSRWQQLARLQSEGPRKWQIRLDRLIRMAVASCIGEKSAYAELRAEANDERIKQRAKRERELADKIMALPDKRYGVILADPEWRFETWSPKGKTATSADNHYPTSALDVIKARPVADIAADDCVLFLWATVPMTPQAFEVMAAWGFNYVSHAAWNKDHAGTGYWFRNKHELLLVGTRGHVPAPAPGTQWESVIEAPVGKHSEKPERVYELIESYFPTLPKIELNARHRREGWEAWGNEAPSDDEVADESISATSADSRALG
jgi:N6-adenosine-specific RNA methylase IME4